MILATDGLMSAMNTTTTATNGRVRGEATPVRVTVDYLADRYGGVLTYGGDGRDVARGLRLAKRLARAAGAEVDDVLVAVRERYGDVRGE